jgi:hypothetical protein
MSERVYKDGTRAGDLVPGSKFYRAFCCGCGEPIRFAKREDTPPRTTAQSQCCNTCVGIHRSMQVEVGAEQYAVKRSHRVRALKCQARARFNQLKKKVGLPVSSVYEDEGW